MTVAVTGMLAILASNIHSPREFTTGVIGYVVVIVLLVVSIIYKLSMEAMTRKTLFLNLWKIGYTKKELNKIVRQEVISYYFVLILIPLVYIVFYIRTFYLLWRYVTSICIYLCFILCYTNYYFRIYYLCSIYQCSS